MAIVHEGLPKSSVRGDEEKPKISRRALVLGGVSTLAAAGVGARLASSGGGESEKSEIVPANLSIGPSEAETTIAKLVQDPNLYAGDRSEINPANLIGMTPEELEALSTIRVTEHNRTSRGFAEDFSKELNRYFVAGLTQWDALNARKEGFPAGERDELGNSLCDYPEYVHNTYGQYMERGLLQRYHGELDSILSIERIRKYQAIAARGFEGDLSATLVGDQTEPTLDRTIYVALDSVEDMPLVAGFDKHLLINMTFTSTSRQFGDIHHWAEAEVFVADGDDGNYKTLFEDFRYAPGTKDAS